MFAIDYVLGAALPQIIPSSSSNSNSNSYNRLVTFWVVTKIEEFLGLDPASGYWHSTRCEFRRDSGSRRLPLGLLRGDYSAHDQARYYERWNVLFKDARRYIEDNKERE